MWRLLGEKSVWRYKGAGYEMRQVLKDSESNQDEDVPDLKERKKKDKIAIFQNSTNKIRVSILNSVSFKSGSWKYTLQTLWGEAKLLVQILNHRGN